MNDIHIRDAIRNLSPYRPGRPLRDLEQFGLTDGVKLASNENPFPPSPVVRKAIDAALEDVRLYPEPGAPELRERLAEIHGCKPTEVIAGAGIDDLLDLAARVMLEPGDNLVMADPGFVRYVVAAGSAGGRAIRVPGSAAKPYCHDLDAMLAAADERTRIMVLVNPNNPTGSMFTRAELESYFERVPSHILTILDEAYFEFVTDPDYPDGMKYLNRDKPVLVFRTFSKCHSLAGLRVGYGVGPEILVDHLDRARLAFNVNSVAQAAALAAVDDHEHLRRSRDLAQAETAFLFKGLAELGWKTEPTWTNFVFAEAPHSGEHITQGLLQRGFIVRPLNGFGLPSHFFRVSHGTRAQDEAFLAALEEVTSEIPAS